MKVAPAPIRLRLPLFGKAPQSVARSLAFLASSEEFKQRTGKFLKGRKVIESNQYSQDQSIQNTFFEQSERLIGT